MTENKIRARIVIVEDEAITALDIRRMLEKEGYQVIATAKNSPEALEAVESGRPDLVLMDIMLSGEADGIETAHEILKRHNIPIVYLTASTDTSTIERAESIKHYGYLIKPVNRTDLQSIIASALEQSAAGDKKSE